MLESEALAERCWEQLGGLFCYAKICIQLHTSLKSQKSEMPYKVSKIQVHHLRLTSIHTCRSYAWPTRWTNRQAHGPRMFKPPHELHTRINPILGLYGASWGADFHKIEDSLSRTPMNRRANFDAPSFILGGDMRNRTKKQNYKQ